MAVLRTAAYLARYSVRLFTQELVRTPAAGVLFRLGVELPLPYAINDSKNRRLHFGELGRGDGIAAGLVPLQLPPIDALAIQLLEADDFNAGQLPAECLLHGPGIDRHLEAVEIRRPALQAAGLVV